MDLHDRDGIESVMPNRKKAEREAAALIEKTFGFEGRRNYLGEGIGPRLGGCSIGGDAGTYYPVMWKNIVEKHSVKTVIDIGCGFGWAAKWFHDNGCKTVGVEGLKHAIEKSPVSDLLILHDYETDGPFIPDQEFDLAWCCEFVEHVDELFMNNFIQTFKSAKLLAMTYAFPGQGGHHHVNEQHSEYWIEALQKAGFKYDDDLTNLFRDWAKLDEFEWNKIESATERETKYKSTMEFHFVKRGLVFRREDK